MAWDSPGPASISFPRSTRGTQARCPIPPCLLEPSFGSPSMASFLPMTHSSQATHFYLAHVFQGFLPLYPQVGKRFLSIVLTFIYLTRKRNYTAHFQGLLDVTLWQTAHWRPQVTEQGSCVLGPGKQIMNGLTRTET